MILNFKWTLVIIYDALYKIVCFLLFSVVIKALTVG